MLCVPSVYLLWISIRIGIRQFRYENIVDEDALYGNKGLVAYYTGFLELVYQLGITDIDEYMLCDIFRRRD